MSRHGYRIFSEGRIANLVLPNRLVRSATWDPCIHAGRKMTQEVLDLYRRLAEGGVGLIITGGFPVYREPTPDEAGTRRATYTYPDLRIDGIERLVETVHAASPGCKVVAQVETGYPVSGPSAVSSPFSREIGRPLELAEIQQVIESFIAAIADMKRAGFDGVQVHAAHRQLLSRFLSPHTNHRVDEYGGSAANRMRIVREIVAGARHASSGVGDFPILIKMNCTDYVDDGIDLAIFLEQARMAAEAGIDAIEVSGGMWDCLVKSEAQLGFRPVPSPEAHTWVNHPGSQSYFLSYAQALRLEIPVILVGGNRDVERLEAIVRDGQADFIALCRPLICEPDLPNRWLEGRGGPAAACLSCNACIYAMTVHPGRSEPDLVTCVFRRDKNMYKAAQEWLSSWVEKNKI